MSRSDPSAETNGGEGRRDHVELGLRAGFSLRGLRGVGDHSDRSLIRSEDAFELDDPPCPCFCRAMERHPAGSPVPIKDVPEILNPPCAYISSLAGSISVRCGKPATGVMTRVNL